VTGLVKYYSVEELQDRLIVVIANLKASKVRTA
jgi:tRNA-binding EMAP/Myf-like protein